jgi:phosphatidylinositol 4-kinase
MVALRGNAHLYSGGLNVENVLSRHRERRHLLQLHVEAEINRLDVWLNPLSDPQRASDHPSPLLKAVTDVRRVDEARDLSVNAVQAHWARLAHLAWSIDPTIAIRMTARFHSQRLSEEVGKLVRRHPERVRDVSEAALLVIDGHMDASSVALRVR